MQSDLVAAFRWFQDHGYIEIITCAATSRLVIGIPASFYLSGGGPAATLASGLSQFDAGSESVNGVVTEGMLLGSASERFIVPAPYK